MKYPKLRSKSLDMEKKKTRLLLEVDYYQRRGSRSHRVSFLAAPLILQRERDERERDRRPVKTRVRLLWSEIIFNSHSQLQTDPQTKPDLT